MKILFTSVGRRVELIQAFLKARVSLAIDCTLIGGDVDKTAPALQFCDSSVILPRIFDIDYVDYIYKFCLDNSVDLIIPTIDTDLLILSKSKGKFCKISTRILISDEDKIAICRDKRLTATFFRKCGMNAPDSCDDVSDYSGTYPCFIKPLDGSASIDAYKVHNAQELAKYADHIKQYVVQPFIEGTEYTVDVFCDFDGKPIYITPRLRIQTRSGEVIKTMISQDSRIIAECEDLIAGFVPCGPLTVQLIRENKTGIDYFIEINPRFGGGAPLSMKAGANSAEALLRLLNGDELSYQKNIAEDGAFYCRFDQSIRIDR